MIMMINWAKATELYQKLVRMFMQKQMQRKLSACPFQITRRQGIITI
jgi:hypothetical protein